MKDFYPKMGPIGLTVLLCLALISFSAEAGVQKKIVASKKFGAYLSRNIIYPGDLPKHEMQQLVRTGDVISSWDPDFNEAVETVFAQTDRIGPSGSARGHAFFLHKNGDKTFVRFEEASRLTFKEDGAWESTGDGKFQFTGGTGKFKDIKGTATYKYKLTPEGGLAYWEAEVEY